jgi:hypothetical protein
MEKITNEETNSDSGDQTAQNASADFCLNKYLSGKTKARSGKMKLRMIRAVRTSRTRGKISGARNEMGRPPLEREIKPRHGEIQARARSEQPYHATEKKPAGKENPSAR